ncbi:MAG: GatB/YqeY domain-containing protein [SAR86 cluster bacterium]|nr:GatB/YqeY domain-containing protein [SAR86 cluster bacterium]|tara:strand:+ start:595 stop:1050 length:456 start_codon:yes stop_codon:yes gene_type:complete
MTENALKLLIQEAVKSSMRNREKEQTSTLRMAISEIQREEIDKKSVLSDHEITTILQRMIKQRKDSFNQFKSAGREELALKEAREIEILSEFLPVQLSVEEINLAVKESIATLNAESPKDIGKVMGSLKARLQGKTDMSLVSKLVKENLTK